MKSDIDAFHSKHLKSTERSYSVENSQNFFWQWWNLFIKTAFQLKTILSTQCQLQFWYLSSLKTKIHSICSALGPSQVAKQWRLIISTTNFLLFFLHKFYDECVGLYSINHHYGLRRCQCTHIGKNFVFIIQQTVENVGLIARKEVKSRVIIPHRWSSTILIMVLAKTSNWKGIDLTKIQHIRQYHQL